MKRLALLALLVVAAGLYALNLGDYFLGDDFDLIVSFHGKPASYLVRLLWSNESGDVWKNWGIDPELGRGYLRPVKIWLLALDRAVWGTNPIGFHLTSQAIFAGTLLVLFAILRSAVPSRPLLAFAGAWIAAVHPVFAEIVPFVTAREETLAILFGLGSFLAFLRHRSRGTSIVPFVALYSAALGTKESAIVFGVLPLLHDAARGGLLPRGAWMRRDLLRVHAVTFAVLVVYFALRFVAFGNFKGGDGTPTHFLSIRAFAAFHAHFWGSLFDRTLFVLGDVPGIMATALICAAATAVALALSARRIGVQRLRALIFFGPLWYFGSTCLLHGSYFATRHHALPVLGLAAFVAVAADAALAAGWLRRERVVAWAILVGSTLFFLPPSVETSLEYHRASAVVSEIRERIEAQTRGLPAGSRVLVTWAPQWTLPPFFFGWGLLSALQRPFTPADVASRSTVVNLENRQLTGSGELLPDHYDLVVSFEPRDWLTPWMVERYRRRHLREGILPEGGALGLVSAPCAPSGLDAPVPGDQHGHVVPRAALECQVDEPAARRLRGARRRQGRGDLLVRGHLVEAVRAEEDGVPSGQAHAVQVYVREGGSSPEHVREHAAQPVGRRALAGQHARLHEELHPRVVPRELPEGAFPAEVRARVPDVGEEEVEPQAIRHRHRRSHAGEGGVGRRALGEHRVEAPVAGRGALQDLLRALLVHLQDPVGRVEQHVDEHDERRAARDLPGRLAAHAVGHGEDVRRLLEALRDLARRQARAEGLGEAPDAGQEKMVLVVRPDLAAIGEPERVHLDLDRVRGGRGRLSSEASRPEGRRNGIQLGGIAHVLRLPRSASSGVLPPM